MQADLPAPAVAQATTEVARARAPAILLLSLTIANSFAARGSFNPVQDIAKLDLGLTDMQMSLVQGVAASIPIAVLSIPLGRIVDRSHRVRLLILLSLLWTAGVAWTAWAQSFETLFFARMVAGLGGVGCIPVAISLVADLTPRASRGRWLLLLTLGNMIGAAAAFVFGGLLQAWLGERGAPVLLGLNPWRGSQLVFAGASLILTMTLLLIREPARHETVEANAGMGKAFMALVARRGFLAPLFVGQLGVVMADTAAAIWAAPILTRDFHQSPAQFGPLLGVIILLSGIVGALIGALSADYGQKLKWGGGILLGAVVMSFIAVPAALFPLATDTTTFAMALGVLLMCGFAAGLITSTAIAVLVPNEARGLCLGAFVVLAGIIGLGVAPTLVTWSSGLLGGESHLAEALAMTTVAIDAFSAIGFLLAMLDLGRRHRPAALA